MRNRILIITAVLLITMSAGAAYAVNKPTVVTEQPHAVIFTPQSLLVQANRLRAEKGVAPLKIDERLNQSAQWKADDMAKFNYFGHVKPGESGTNGTQTAINYTGKDCVLVSENYEYSTTIASPFDWWVTSKSHYTAIIDARYDATGFGYALVNGKHTYVEHFCDLK